MTRGTAIGCGLLLGGALACSAMRTSKPSQSETQPAKPLPGDEPGRQDTSKDGRATPEPRDFPDTDVGRLLAAHMQLLAGQGPDAEERYQASLALLKSRAPEMTRTLIESYGRLAEERYFRRWALLETLREVHAPSALEFALRVAEEPLPPERFSGDPERRSADEEIRIRVKAVEVLSALAAERAPGADAALLRLVRERELGIRRTAIRGFLAAGGRSEQEARAERLRQTVDPKDYGLITLETTEIRKVEHPEMPSSFEIRKARRPEGAAPRVER